MKRFLLASAAAAALFTSPVFAADPGMPMEEAPVGFSWTGAYVGAFAGYNWGDYRQFSAAGVGVNVDVDGFAGGAFVGYNFQFSNNIVVGAEADISTGLDGTTAQGTAGPFWSCNTGACNTDIDWYATIRARLGYAIDRFHVYGTGGLAIARADGGIFNSAQQGVSHTETGWTAGAGLEYAFTNNIFVRGEYLHVDLGNIRFGTGVGTEAFNGDGDFDTVRLGVAYKF